MLVHIWSHTVKITPYFKNNKHINMLYGLSDVKCKYSYVPNLHSKIITKNVQKIKQTK